MTYLSALAEATTGRAKFELELVAMRSATQALIMNLDRHFRLSTAKGNSFIAL